MRLRTNVGIVIAFVFVALGVYGIQIILHNRPNTHASGQDLQKQSKARDIDINCPELDEYCKPADYKPENDAVTDYKNAFELYVEMPDGLDMKDLHVWPAELSSEKLVILKNWISLNERALAALELGIEKPYCRLTYKCFVLPPMSIFMVENFKIRELTSALTARAQIKVTNGDIDGAVSDIVSCYRFSRHFEQQKTCIEQLIGVSIKAFTSKAIRRILHRTTIDAALLKELQDAIQAVSAEQTAPVDFSGEMIYCHELIRRSFIDDGTGQSRLNSSEVTFPDKEETIKLTDEIFNKIEKYKYLNPAELRDAGVDIDAIVQEYTKSDAFLKMQIPDYSQVHHIAYRCKADTDALITIIALLRYCSDRGEFPDELAELVKAGYLNSEPVDPYSNAPLVYKKTGSDFLLYSFGTDFDDDSRIRGDVAWDIKGGDIVFWPFVENKQNDKIPSPAD